MRPEPRNPKPGIRNRDRNARLVWLAAAVFVVVLIYMYRLATYRPPRAYQPVTVDEVARAEQAVENLRRQIVEVREAAEEGKREEFEILVPEQDINNFLRAQQGMGRRVVGNRVEAPTIAFRDRRVVSSAYVTVHGRKLYMTIVGQLTRSSAGKMLFRSDSVRVGRLPAPSFVAARVDRAINDYIASGGSALPADVTEVTTDAGILTLRGVSNPNALR